MRPFSSVHHLFAAESNRQVAAYDGQTNHGMTGDVLFNGLDYMRYPG